MKPSKSILLRSLSYGFRSLASRRIYFLTMIVVPIFCAFFLLDLMQEGLPLQVPAAVVDLDDSSMSRRLTQNLGSTELIDVKYRLSSYNEALNMVKEGKIYGFFLIPEDFQRDAVGGRGPTISYYSNMTFFVPGTLSYKGFKTMAVTTSGGIVRTTLVSKGLSDAAVGDLLQPVVMQEHALNNPWLSYSVYLCNSFIPGVIALMVMLVAAYSITDEIKQGTSIKWLEEANGSMVIALFGKLLPQTIVFSTVGIMIQAWLYGWEHFPLNCPVWHMTLAMVMLVIGSQALAVIICCIIPNLRMGVSIASLIGILSFSVTGFSFPVESMYDSVAIFSYIIPLRYYFLIYVDQALNGIDLFFSRWWYIALCIFPVVSLLGLSRLKKHCLNPVYVP